MKAPVGIDSRAFDAYISASSDDLMRARISALKAVARSIKEPTIEHMKSRIEKPTAFTVSRGAVQSYMRSGREPYAIIKIADRQAAYLSAIEHGTDSENLAQPFKGAVDRYGNVTKRFFRTAANKASVAANPAMFVGRPRGRDDEPAGIYQRTNKNKRLRPLVRFVDIRRNRKTLGMMQFWNTEIPRLLEREYKRELIESKIK